MTVHTINAHPANANLRCLKLLYHGHDLPLSVFPAGQLPLPSILSLASEEALVVLVLIGVMTFPDYPSDPSGAK